MSMDLGVHSIHGGVVEQDGSRWRLTIPAGSAREYRVAQAENYPGLTRRRFPDRPPRTLSLRARVSNASVAGTWGFGFWNDPFGASLRPFRPFPTLPNAAWYFYASPESHLSFREGTPPNGLLAQAFSSQPFDLRLIPAALALPFSRPAARHWLGRVIDEAGATVTVDPTTWHAYSLRWEPHRLTFQVDDEIVLESMVVPRPPLGLVIWIDNQYAAFTPEGRLAWGLLSTDAAAWLEIEDLQLNQ